MELRQDNPFEIIFYQQPNGRCPVEEFLDGIPANHLDKILREIDLLGQCARNLREPYVKHLEDSLWELRM